MTHRKASLDREKLRVEEDSHKIALQYTCKYQYNGEVIEKYASTLERALNYLRMELWRRKFENNDYNEHNEPWRYE